MVNLFKKLKSKYILNKIKKLIPKIQLLLTEFIFIETHKTFPEFQYKKLMKF